LSVLSSTAPAPSGSVLSEARPANNEYFPALDGIRALAFLMVFGHHYLQLIWGWAGVEVFFVLSGFLITGILFDTRNEPHRVRNFYVRRTLRIFPLYYGLMILLALSYPLFRWQWTWAWLMWPAYMGNFCRGFQPFIDGSAAEMLADFQPLSATFTGVHLYLGHFWSLCVEEQFYLVWPWVVFWIRDRRKLLYVCLAYVVICPLMRFVGSHTLPQVMLDEGVLSHWTPFCADALLFGGLIALVRRGSSSSSSRQWLLKAARTVFWVMFSVGLAYLLFGMRRFAHPEWRETWGLAFIDVFSACLIVMAIERGSITYRIFNLRPLRWLGRISYGAYVFHDIFHPEIKALVQQYTSTPKYWTAAVSLPLTLLLAWASFRWFESPFIRLKERWTRG
jgi:peptidoglycan/LPS O-acetylase OafA/YrhL